MIEDGMTKAKALREALSLGEGLPPVSDLDFERRHAEQESDKAVASINCPRCIARAGRECFEVRQEDLLSDDFSVVRAHAERLSAYYSKSMRSDHGGA